MKKCFDIFFDYKKLDKKIRNIFFSFLIVFFSAFLLLNFSVFKSTPEAFVFMVVYTTVHQQLFLNYVLLVINVVAVSERLQVLSNFDYKFSSNGDEFSHQILNSLMQFHKIIHIFNNYFKPCFVQTIFMLYFTLIINLFWLGLIVLGFGYTGLTEPVLMVLPNLSISLYLADCDRKIKRNISKIVSKNIKIKSAVQEDILIFILGKKFYFGAFDFVNIGYSTLTNVSPKIETRK